MMSRLLQYSRPLVLGDVSEELDVGEGQLGDGSHAAAGAAAGQRVGCAGSHLLGGEDGHIAPLGDLGVGLDHGGGAEGPAAAAGLLVLDGGDGALLPPVHRLGQLGGSLGGGGQAPGGGGHAGGLLVAAHVLGLELLIGQVTELVDA